MGHKAVFVYAWDLADEGVAEVAGRLRAAGADTVALATAYHAGKFVRPHGVSGKVYFPDDGTIYFRHRPERYGRVKPVPHPMLEHFEPLAELARAAPDLARVGWTVCCHNTRLGMAHPELIARNALGDGLIYSLNPAHPDVRDYVVALCRDQAEHHELAALTLETPGWLGYEHGYHHEFALVPLDAWIGLLLGLCFAPETVATAKAAGIDAEALRRRIAGRIEAWLASDVATAPGRAAEWVQADLATDGELGAYLRWRCRVVADLVAEIRAAVPRSTELRVIPSVQRPTARGWIEGSDLALLAASCDAIELCAYEPSAAAVAADVFDVRQRVGETARLCAILRPSHPDLAGGAETVPAARALKAAGVDGLAFYNYGHWRLPALAHVKAAFAAWDEEIMNRFIAKTVLITGAGRGIGRATALRLAREGAAVAVADIDAEPAHELAREIGAMGRTAVALVEDVAAAGAAERLVTAAEKALGPLHVLVNNAARAGNETLAATDAAGWEAEVAVTLEAPFALAKAALPGMVERGKGAIVNIASVNGLMVFGNPAYSAAKAGLLALTRQIAVEYGPKGVRCNAVSPGTIMTESPSWQKRIARDPEVFAKLARWYPVGRVGRPDDIAQAVAFLAADEAEFVNGANLVVDGGLTAGMPLMAAELSTGAD